MKISILTLFPHMFDNFISESIIKRAIEKDLIEMEIVDIRKFSKLNNNQVDDTPYGGGAGMVMMVEPVVDAINSVKTEEAKVYLMSPSGVPFKESTAYELSKIKHLILICGHYEGIDDRISYYIDGEISIGDYVLTGGEIPAMVVSDAVIRLVDGVIKDESKMNESFNNKLLDYPTYTKPPIYDGHEVPEVLLSGHHKNIDAWRKKEQEKRTSERRPDLMD
ncbi:MAG: tRNA (guanosine(37)-N1)-methyltransferase TrmD [Bacilli bacterium]|nr:tRNA (guanosine(37)-N1)-methyltransferase TrmD [Bacilli bacterium]